MNVNDDTPAPAASAVTATPRQGALRIVGVYVLVSFLWILLSDRTVVWLFDDAEAMARMPSGLGVCGGNRRSAVCPDCAVVGAACPGAGQVSHRRWRWAKASAAAGRAAIAGIGGYVLDIRRHLEGRRCATDLRHHGGRRSCVQGWVALIHPDRGAWRATFARGWLRAPLTSATASCAPATGPSVGCGVVSKVAADGTAADARHHS
jgi:hypothetical protein